MASSPPPLSPEIPGHFLASGHAIPLGTGSCQTWGWSGLVRCVCLNPLFPRSPPPSQRQGHPIPLLVGSGHLPGLKDKLVSTLFQADCFRMLTAKFLGREDVFILTGVSHRPGGWHTCLTITHTREIGPAALISHVGAPRRGVRVWAPTWSSDGGSRPIPLSFPLPACARGAGP